eukprot:jgi/Botrbrau1/17842/Bobra.0127s0085.2
MASYGGNANTSLVNPAGCSAPYPLERVLSAFNLIPMPSSLLPEPSGVLDEALGCWLSMEVPPAFGNGVCNTEVYNASWTVGRSFDVRNENNGFSNTTSCEHGTLVGSDAYATDITDSQVPFCDNPIAKSPFAAEQGQGPEQMPKPVFASSMSSSVAGAEDDMCGGSQGDSVRGWSNMAGVYTSTDHGLSDSPGVRRSRREATRASTMATAKRSKEPGVKKKVGRPIAFQGNPDELSPEEQKRVKRRKANRESAQRVRLRRLKEFQTLSEQLKMLTTSRDRANIELDDAMKHIMMLTAECDKMSAELKEKSLNNHASSLVSSKMAICCHGAGTDLHAYVMSWPAGYGRGGCRCFS